MYRWPLIAHIQGRKMLREDHAHSHSRSRSPTVHRDSRLHRSRSPLEASRRHNTTRGSSTSPRRRGRQAKDARIPEPHDRNGRYTTRQEDRHVHFTREPDTGRKPTGTRSRSPAKRMADFSEELYFASDERKTRMERIEQEWQTYNKSMPPPSTA